MSDSDAELEERPWSLQNVNLHQVEIQPSGLRFMVLHLVRGWHYRAEDGGYEWHVNDKPIYEIYGGTTRVNLFKTIKNAFKVAKEHYAWLSKKDRAADPANPAWNLKASKVLVFDPNYLPMVAADDQLFEIPNAPDKLTDAEFCERQVALWADLHEKALEREKHKPVERCGLRKSEHAPGEVCILPPRHRGKHKYGAA